MPFDNLQIEREAGVATLTIQRPQRLNALDARTLDELRQAALDVQQDSSIRSIILTGGGDNAFVAGADLGEIAHDTPESARRRALDGQQVFDLIEQLGKPVMAAVNGFASAAGVSWRCRALCGCRRTARFGQPEMNLG